MKKQKKKIKNPKHKINLNFERPTDEKGKKSFAALFKCIALTLKIVKFKTGRGRSYTYSYRYYDSPTNSFFLRPIKSTTLHLIDLNNNTHKVVHTNVPFVKEFKEEIANYLFPLRFNEEVTDQQKREDYDNDWAKKNTRIDRRKPHTIKYFKGNEPTLSKQNFIMSQVRDFNQA